MQETSRVLYGEEEKREGRREGEREAGREGEDRGGFEVWVNGGEKTDGTKEF